MPDTKPFTADLPVIVAAAIHAAEWHGAKHAREMLEDSRDQCDKEMARLTEKLRGDIDKDDFAREYCRKNVVKQTRNHLNNILAEMA